MAKRTEIDDPKINALKEMVLFLDSHVGMSYNDLMTYAHDNDKTDWLDTVRSPKYRAMIAQCAREKRQIDDVPYTNSLIDSLNARVEARDEYRERNPKWFMENND